MLTQVTAWGLDLAKLPDSPDPRLPRSKWPTTPEQKEEVWVDVARRGVLKGGGYPHLSWAERDILTEYSPHAPMCVSTVAFGPPQVT
jgi:hypothetical protein